MTGIGTSHAVSIKSKATQFNLVQTAMKSINLVDTKDELRMKRMGLPGERRKAEMLLGQPEMKGSGT